MDAQAVMLGARVAKVRELKAELEAARAEKARLADEYRALKAHFDLALLAAQDLRALPAEGEFVIVDGWNQILGADRRYRSREELTAAYRRHLEAHPGDFVWIVYDGPRLSSSATGRLRVTYTGTQGAHRADRLIVDFLRMAVYLDLAARIRVETDDRDFRRAVDRLLR